MQYLVRYSYLLILLTIFSCTRDIVEPAPVTNCDEGVVYFEKDILPVIVSSCATSGCHANKKPKEGIRLHNTSNILKYVKKGNPEKSKLYKYLGGVIDLNDKDVMPPNPAAPLTSKQIEDIYQWIKNGANFYSCETDCVVESVSFKDDINPIVQKYCVGCHSTSSASGNVRLDNYDKVKQYAQRGSLIGTIKKDNGYTVMPPSGSSVDNCDIQKIQLWIDEGSLNN